MPPIAAMHALAAAQVGAGASTTSPAHSMPSTRGKRTASPEPPARVISSERLSPKRVYAHEHPPGPGLRDRPLLELQHLGSAGLVDDDGALS